jgi:hypothetical protein
VQADSTVHLQWGNVDVVQGTALITSPGSMRATAGDITVRGFDGSFQMSRAAHGDIVTVRAISTPLLVSVGTQSVIIPVGAETTLRAGVREEIVPIAEQRYRDILLGMRRSAEGALPTAGEGMAAALHAAARDSQSAVAALVTDIHDPELWLLVSFHPRYREAAWSAPPSREMPDAARIERWLQFCHPLDGQKSDIAARMFGDQVGRAIHQSSDGSSLASSILDRCVPTLQDPAVGVLSRQRLRTALQTAFASLPEGVLDDQHKQMRASLTVAPMDDIPPYVEPPPSSSSSATSSSIKSSSSSSAMPPATPEEARAVIEQAKEILLQSGGLFTLQTELIAVDRDTVNVRGIIYSGPRGDLAFQFHLYVPDAEVRDIHQGDRAFLYYLPLERFVTWAKGGAQ